MAAEIDLVKALEAKLKQARGEPLDAAETKLVARYDKQLMADMRQELLSHCPKGVYSSLSGRDQKVLNEQSHRYKLPIGSAEINLYDLIKRFHDLLVEWGPAVKELDGEHGKLKMSKMKAEIEVLHRRRESLDLEIQQQQQRFIDRGALRARLDMLAGRFRKASEILGKRFGADAQEILNSAITQMDSEI